MKFVLVVDRNSNWLAINFETRTGRCVWEFGCHTAMLYISKMQRSSCLFSTGERLGSDYSPAPAGRLGMPSKAAEHGSGQTVRPIRAVGLCGVGNTGTAIANT